MNKQLLDVLIKLIKEFDGVDYVIKELQPKDLLSVAISCLDTDVSPNDDASDEYGCADSLTRLIQKVDPDFPHHVSTTKLFKELDSNPKYKRTLELKPGNIIISPTGYGKNSSVIPNGHCGVFGHDNIIMSNNSYTGNWEANYTLDTWIIRYRNRGNN